jgi:predicted transcriptional regulator
MNVILSIKPQYANAIMRGEKKVEFRKSSFKQKINKVFIYSSAPEQRIIGYFTIETIISNSPKKLWDEFNPVGSIDRESFFDYFANKDVGFSIVIKKVNKFKKAIDPKMIIQNFVPPQSYMYCEDLSAAS